jgi:hypothetical protein
LIGERSAKAGGTQLGSGGNGGSPSASGRGNPKVDARGQSGCGDEGGAGDGSLWWFRTRFRGPLVSVVPKAREETARSRRPSDGFTRGSEGAAASGAAGKARPGWDRSFPPSFGRLHSRLRKRGRFGRGWEGAARLGPLVPAVLRTASLAALKARPVVTARSRRPSDGFTRGSESGTASGAAGKARPGCNRSFSPSFGRLHSRL